ncbi:Partner of SLD fivePSF1 family protein [Aphelenchoides avenae]|nr:Partner of SLD fivePSF1 family protein [Aphelenchus avenae]KAH7702766.1 Partner of SLD fivePSF1 family protein [Aphelenchus avenae]KAH7717197.1 Partner of SLD fivePSF1 family protein [Aphelenchus avenae]
MSSCFSMLRRGESSSNATLTDSAEELIRQLHNNPDTIPAFDQELLDRCSKQIRQMYEENLNTLLSLRDRASPPEETMTLVRARQNAMERIKRCCCVYITERMKRLKDLRWKHGGQIPLEIKRNLSKQELEWLDNYNNALSEFQLSISNAEKTAYGVNLLRHAHPPKNLLVTVKALQNSEVEINGKHSMPLIKGSMHAIPYDDAQLLEKRGVVERMEH